jgi:hypothetical protein
MTDPGDRELDRLLKDAGARWRETQPAPRYSPLVLGPRARSSRLQPYATLIAVVAGAVLVVGVYSTLPARPVPNSNPPVAGVSASPTTEGTPTRFPTPQMTASPDPLGMQVIEEGDRVAARGVVRDMRAAGLFICSSDLGGFAGDDGDGECFGVPVVGVDGPSLPGWSDGRSAVVEITGRWTGAALAVEQVIEDVPPASSPTTSPRYAPCPEPPSGWTPDRAAGADEEAARRLQAELEAHPELYSRAWLAVSDPRLSSVSTDVAVVGTVGNIDAVRKRIEEIYPYNLCVTAVTYTEAELREVASRLNQRGWPWVANLSAPWLNRVVLSLPLLDAHTREWIGQDSSKLILDPLVRKLP